MHWLLFACNIVTGLLAGLAIGSQWEFNRMSRELDEIYEWSRERSRELDALKIDIATNAANMQRTAKMKARS